jgi:hypothetical protein
VEWGGERATLTASAAAGGRVRLGRSRRLTPSRQPGNQTSGAVVWHSAAPPNHRLDASPA